MLERTIAMGMRYLVMVASSGFRRLNGRFMEGVGAASESDHRGVDFVSAEGVFHPN